MLKTRQQNYVSILSSFSRVLDVLAIVAGSYLAFYSRFSSFELPPQYMVATLLCSLLVVFGFEYSRIYISWRGREPLLQFRAIFFIWTGVMMFLVFVAFVTKTGDWFSRQWFLSWSVISLLWLYLLRALLSIAVIRMMEKGWSQKKFIIYGGGQLAKDIKETIKDSPWVGLQLQGIFDEQGRDVDGNLDDLISQVNAGGIQEVWVALPLRDEYRLKKVMDSLSQSTVTIRYVPDLMGFRLLNHSVMEIAGIPVVTLSGPSIDGINILVKSIEDKLLALIILLLVSPLMVLIALIIKLTSRGPVFFVQRRTGWDGGFIDVYKFRTMKPHTEKNNKLSQATRNDPRVTRVGTFLRRTSLDELPQFINVLQGRMSIVGPRPHPVEQNDMYKQVVDDYMKRHKVKPGITGWAQVNGFRGETDTVEKMRKRVEYDFFYIENWSLWFDMKIIMLTMIYGFVHKNAY